MHTDGGIRSLSLSLSLSLCLSFVVACTARDVGVHNGAGSTAPSSHTKGTLLSGAANPIPLTVSTDDTATASATVGPDGGTLDATAADGTKFTLTVPKSALEFPTNISMTPLRSVTGIPWGDTGSVGVQFSPDGLHFDADVSLVITPSSPLPADQQIAFGFSGANHALELAPVDPKATNLTILLQHFSGYGLSKGLLADIEPVRQRLGGTDEARIQSQLGAALQAERQRQLLGGAAGDSSFDFAAYAKEWEEKVVKPRVAAAGESCAAGRLAIQTVLGFERQKQLLGASEDGGIEALLGPVFDTASLKCMQEEYELCRDQHIIHRVIGVYLGIERSAQLLGIADSNLHTQAAALVKKCLTFRIDFHSQMSFDDGDHVSSTVDAKVPLSFDIDAIKITGSSTLDNPDFQMSFEGCSVTPKTGGGTMTVTGLTYKVLFSTPTDEVGHVEDLTLTYYPGITSESATIKCDGGSVPFPPSPIWTAAFIITHASEIDRTGSTSAPSIKPADLAGGLLGGGVDLSSFGDAGPGFVTTEWQVKNQSLFATKDWTKSDSVGVIEAGTLKLYHTPG